MAGHGLKLLTFPRATSYKEFEQIGQALLDSCPEAGRFSDEETEEFFILAHMLDEHNLKDLRRKLPRAGLSIPPRLQVDQYRLARYVIRSSWQNPDLRPRLLNALVRIHVRNVNELRNSPDMKPFRSLFHGQGPLGALWLLRHEGMANRMPELFAALTDEEHAWYRGQRLNVRYMLHRILTDADLANARITVREQRQIVRRIRRQETHLRNLRCSLYRLSDERKALVAAVRGVEREAEAELVRLGGQLEQLRLALAELEHTHAHLLAERAARHAVEGAYLQAQCDEELADQAAALTCRHRWAPAAPLAGRRIAVVGAESLEHEFRRTVERLGGSLVHFSGVDRLARLSGGLGDADVILLMTSEMKHAADWVVRKAASADALMLRCSAAGAISLERFLSAEVLPRLAAALAEREGATRL